MGNAGSNGSGRRSNRSHPPPANPSPPQPPAAAAATAPFPGQYPNPNAPPFYHYAGYYPPPPPVPSMYTHQFRGGGVGFGGMAPGNWGRPDSHCGGPHHTPAPYMDHQKAVTIRNNVNVKKESLRVEPDEENPGRFLVAFTFDATSPGSLTIMFFAKEDTGFKHIVTKESSLKAITMPFEQGLGQKFRQPAGTGIDFSLFDKNELTNVGSAEVYPLVVKAEACSSSNGERGCSPGNSQITQAVFEKDKGQHQVRVMKQILWVDGMRYELQEIYGIGNTVDSDFDGNDSGKECVICLSEPRDTTVLPCRHMCMCSGCAKVLRFQTDRCPICRQPVERLLEIKVSNESEG